MEDSPYISVIIASYRRPSLLVPCVKSVLDNDYRSFEILVVWQGADKETEEAVKSAFSKEKRLKTFHCKKLGATHARNLGASKSRGELLVFIDDDAVATKSWLSGYVDLFKKVEPQPGIAGGKVKPDWVQGRPSWYPKEREFLLGLYDIGDRPRPFPEGQLPFMANLALPKVVFEEVGGIDGRLGFDASKKEIISGADSLLALRVKDAGYSIHYEPRALVYHKIFPSKVTKSFFLKRHYYEGKSFIRMQIYRTNIKAEQIPNVLRFHLKKIVKDITYLTGGLFSLQKISRSRIMLCLSTMLLSLGICMECKRHMRATED